MCSQTFRSGRSSVLNHPVALVGQSIRRVGAERILAWGDVRPLHHFDYQSFISWKCSRNNLGLLRLVPELIAVSFGNFNSRSLKTAIVRCQDILGIDWPRAHIQKVTTRTIDSQAIPASWSKHAKIEGGSVVGERLGRLWADRYRLECALGRFQRLGLALRSTSELQGRNLLGRNRGWARPHRLFAARAAKAKRTETQHAN